MLGVRSYGPDALGWRQGVAAAIGLLRPSVDGRFHLADALGEYNVRMPDLFHVIFAPATFNT
jgi:hypothetical protein